MMMISDAKKNQFRNILLVCYIYNIYYISETNELKMFKDKYLSTYLKK